MSYGTVSPGKFLAFAALFAAATAMATPAGAQFQLPGAKFRQPSAQQPSTRSGKSSGSGRSSSSRVPNSPANPGKPVKLRPPSEDTLAELQLRHNGRRGMLLFKKSPGGLALTTIVLDGDVISTPGKTCRIEVPGGPHTVRFDGFSNGLRKYAVDLAQCPFSFTVLDGALIATYNKSSVSTALGRGTCTFKEKNCRGYLAGVWGPSGRSFTKNTYRGIEKARGRSERDARANFQALLRANQGDKKGIRAVAADQAGFSARREERCRDYLREHIHGFCASRVTEARAIGLGAKLNETITAKNKEIAAKRAERDAKRQRRR